MSNTNVYLFIGDDEISKIARLKELKQEILSDGSSDFNLETLSAKKLKKETLEEALLRLPIKSKKRILIVRGAEDFSKDCKERILTYLKNPVPYLALIIEAKSPDKDIDKIKRYAQVLDFTKGKPRDVFALGKAIKSRKQSLALSILSDLLLKGENPQKIMGGLIWQWERMQGSLTSAKFKKGFDLLLEADISIKSSSLKIDTALELLVVKLTLLI